MEDRPSRQNFHSPKLTREDAERVMNELSEREKELQAKMRTQKPKSHPKERDW